MYDSNSPFPSFEDSAIADELLLQQRLLQKLTLDNKSLLEEISTLKNRIKVLEKDNSRKLKEIDKFNSLLLNARSLETSSKKKLSKTKSNEKQFS